MTLVRPKQVGCLLHPPSLQTSLSSSIHNHHHLFLLSNPPHRHQRHEDPMSTKNDTSWMPPNGSYPVTVGSSLAGALKANKGLPQAPKLSDRGFYSFRCTSPSLSPPPLPTVGYGGGQVAGLALTRWWPVNTERVCVWTDNFKPESIDHYKPGTIEVKKEGDRKTTTIERASIVVSPIISPPERFQLLYHGIICL